MIRIEEMWGAMMYDENNPTHDDENPLLITQDIHRKLRIGSGLTG